MLDKALKVLWLLNGVLILVIASYAFYRFLAAENVAERDRQHLDTAATRKSSDGVVETPSFIVGDIRQIKGTTFHLLPLSVQEGHSANKQRRRRNDRILSENNVNLIFLNIDYKVITKLLDKPAFIHRTEAPLRRENGDDIIDPAVKNIFYLISFEDSNIDGKLNELDNADLYISDVDGSDLTQVTDGVDVKACRFINNNSELLIAYKKRERTAGSRRHFAKYQIDREELVELSELDQEIVEAEKLISADSTNTRP